MGIIRGSSLILFFWNFRGARIIRGETLLEVIRYTNLLFIHNGKKSSDRNFRPSCAFINLLQIFKVGKFASWVNFDDTKMQNSLIALICAPCTLKTVWAKGLSNGVEIFLFDGVEVKCDKTRALFLIVRSFLSPIWAWLYHIRRNLLSLYQHWHKNKRL